MWPVEGQERAVRVLRRALEEQRLHHAYLLVGPPHVGKGALALALAQAVNCAGPDPPCGACTSCRRIGARLHADVQVIDVQPSPEARQRTEIGIELIRDLQHAAALQPYEGRTRVFIIDGAERLSQEAANSLLKTLEEPPPSVMLLLLAVHEEDLPSTISSRCHRLEVRPLPVEGVATLLRERFQAPAERALELARLSRGCLGWALRAAQDPAVMEQREREVQRLADLAQAPLSQRFAYADEVARLFQRHRPDGQQRLYLLLRWWQDLLLDRQGLGEEIAHLAHRQEVEEMAARFSAAEVAEFLYAILETLKALDRNANARLALEVLMLRMPKGATPPGVSQGVLRQGTRPTSGPRDREEGEE